jgi:Zn-dependent M28 family amino/carboxypeptidase
MHDARKPGNGNTAEHGRPVSGTCQYRQSRAMHPLALVVAAAALVAACSSAVPPAAAPDLAAAPASGRSAAAATALSAVQGADFLQHIGTLSSDDFEGRSVGTPGETRTVDYLTDQFRQMGLKPGNPDGRYVQDVPLTRHVSHPEAVIEVGGTRMPLRYPDDYVAFSYERSAQVHVQDSDLVFVGYGVKAPEYDWDDFKGRDLHGKTLVVLINDPQVPDPADPTRLDPALFKGSAMTYYGRWTYKYETAAALGAAAVLIVHETATAAYPYAVVVNSWSRDNFDLHSGSSNPDFPPVSAWITLDRAKAVFAAAGQDFDALKRRALRRDFEPVSLQAKLDITVQNEWQDIASHNVVALIEGSDPALKDQYLLYTAHWDHFGWDPKLPGSKHEQIFHGALDNASGVAALLELARAFQALPVPPRRSILFMATTGEERGLLGAEYYARNPLVPLRDTLADINIDGMNLWGRTRDIQVVGLGNSGLDALLQAAAKAQGRVVLGDQKPENGSFYRADQFAFAKQGLPSLFTRSGDDYIGKPAGFGKERRESYTANNYHKVTDVVQPEWDTAGAVEDIGLLFDVGYAVAQGAHFPQWNAGTEFKARRDRMMTGTSP